MQIRLPQPCKVAATLFGPLFCVWYFCGMVVVWLWYCCGIVVIWLWYVVMLLWYVCGGRGKQHSPNGRTKIRSVSLRSAPWASGPERRWREPSQRLLAGGGGGRRRPTGEQARDTGRVAWAALYYGWMDVFSCVSSTPKPHFYEETISAV